MTGKSGGNFDWSVALILLMIGAFTAALVPQDRWNWSARRFSGMVAWFGRSASRVQVPEVLLVSRQAGDRFAVSATLEPRGYQIYAAPDPDAALAELRKNRARIGWVVVDESYPGARQMLLAARKLSPEACPILLKGRREPAEIAHILVEAMDRHLTPVQARELQQESLLNGTPVAR